MINRYSNIGQSNMRRARPRKKPVFFDFVRKTMEKPWLLILSIILLFGILAMLFWSRFGTFLILTGIAFLSKFLFSKSDLPIDFSMIFFLGLIITHKFGLGYLLVFLFVADILAIAVAQRDLSPLRIFQEAFQYYPEYVTIILVCGLSAFIGGNLFINGIVMTCIHYPLRLLLRYAVGWVTPLTLSYGVTGMVITIFYFLRIMPLINNIIA